MITEADAPQDDKPAKASDDQALIGEAVKFLTAAASDDSTNRADALDDLWFVQGSGQWPEQIKAMRQLEGRPCLTINTLPTMLHQVTNDLRQNKPAIKVHPVDDDADVKTAEIMQGLIRHIEYDSNATSAYVGAASYAAASGAGYFEALTEYEAEDTFDQVIKIRRIRNPFTVYMGPHIEPDGSDMKRCMIVEDMPRRDFMAEYPKADATAQDFSGGIGNQAPGWVAENTVRVARYFRVECDYATLCLLSTGDAVFKDELPDPLPEGVTVEKERKSERRKVMVYKLTACEILESTEIACNWIPVFPVYGDELDINGKVFRSGLIRHAKDPARMYNFWMTSATEEVSLRPKTPYIGAEGQFEGFEEQWATANKVSHSYLEYRPVSLDGSMAPPPQRQPMADVPAGVLTMASHARDNIKATMGLFDASLGARGSAKSGKQELAQQREGDTAQYHYADNLNITLRHLGRCLLWMIPRYYDTPRAIRILGDDEKPASAKINQPYETGKVDPETQAVEVAMHDLSVGKYDCTITSGPSYTTLRQEAAESMIAVSQSFPELWKIAGDKMVRAMDWPGADGIADRIAKTIPAELRGDEDGEAQTAMVQTPKGPVPVEQASQMLAQMDQGLKEMSQQLDEATSGIKKAEIDANAKIKVAEINATSRQDVEELKGMIQIIVQKMQPPPMLVADAMVEGKAGDVPESPPMEPPPQMAAPEQTEAPQGAFSLPEQQSEQLIG